MTRISPDESHQAPIRVIAKRIRAGADTTEMAAWRNVILSVPARFYNKPNADSQYFHLANVRDKTMGEARAIVHKPSQVIIDTWLFKCRKEAILGHQSAKAMAELYASHLSDTTSPDNRSGITTIEACFTVYDKMFHDKTLRALIVDLERNLLRGHVTIPKLLDLTTKCKHNVIKVIWTMKSIQDRIKCNVMEPGEFTQQAIKAKHNYQPKAFVDLFLTKKTARDYLLGPCLDVLNIKEKTAIRDTFNSHDSYRGVRPIDGTTTDTTWMAFWPESSTMYFDLCETVIYQHNSSDEAIIRTGMKAGKGIKEILEDNSQTKYGACLGQ